MPTSVTRPDSPATAVVTIDPRYRGPATSANGGYASGSVARHLPGPAEVTLWRPPPLATAMDVVADEDHYTLWDGDQLVAEARPTLVRLAAPAAPSLEAAARATADYPLRDDHPWPTCFVCGTARAPGDGLNIFPGPVPGARAGVIAAPWTPTADVADADGIVRPEVVWAALDCPSGVQFLGTGPSMLARISADITGTVTVGRPYILLGWPEREDGRKRYGGSALFDADGTLLGVAEALWIELKT